MSHSPTGSDFAEAQAFLEAHPAIEAFDIVLTDVNGIGRGKIIRRHELEALYTSGRNLPISILGLDITGEDVHETGLVWDTGDGDMIGWPIPGTLKPLYSTAPARGQVLMSMFDRQGAPMAADPRLGLKRQVDALAAEGLFPAGAFELEFFLLANERDSNGKVQPARAVLDNRKSHKTEVYSVDHLHGMEPLFSDIYAAAKLQNLPAETLISEFAPGQFELTLNYRRDVVQAADDLIMLKRIVRMAARRHGVTACFMAKPIADYAGSGMHFHVSLQDGSGTNVFAPTGPGHQTKLLHAIGGMSATMGESMLVFAPHANSWRRFVSASYAPVSASWGVNNRSVALRVPAGNPMATRIEHRTSGVDANPYLVAATVLAALRKGLAEQLDPGPEVTGNGYEGNKTPSNLPRDWRMAIEAAQNSAFLKEALGEGLHRTFTAIKQAEYMRVARTIADVDFDLYLHEV
jgi:glutamine synthetase